jgi:hypothetical protein
MNITKNITPMGMESNKNNGEMILKNAPKYTPKYMITAKIE